MAVSLVAMAIAAFILFLDVVFEGIEVASSSVPLSWFAAIVLLELPAEEARH